MKKWIDEYGRPTSKWTDGLGGLVMCVIIIGLLFAAVGTVSVMNHSPVPVRAWGILLGGASVAITGIVVLLKAVWL